MSRQGIAPTDQPRREAEAEFSRETMRSGATQCTRASEVDWTLGHTLRMDAAWAVVWAGLGGGLIGFAGTWINARSSAQSAQKQSAATIKAVKKQAEATLKVVEMQAGNMAAVRAEEREDIRRERDRSEAAQVKADRDRAERALVAAVHDSVLWAGAVANTDKDVRRASQQVLMDDVMRRLHELTVVRLDVETQSISGLAQIAGDAISNTQIALTAIYDCVTNGHGGVPDLPTAERALELSRGILMAVRIERGLDIDAWMVPGMPANPVNDSPE